MFYFGHDIKREDRKICKQFGEDLAQILFTFIWTWTTPNFTYILILYASLNLNFLICDKYSIRNT